MGDYLAHFGIKGQVHGRRRFQNKDGSLTREGFLRYYGHLPRRFGQGGDENSSTERRRVSRAGDAGSRASQTGMGRSNVRASTAPKGTQLREWGVNTFNNTRVSAGNAYNSAKNWATNNVINPLTSGQAREWASANYNNARIGATNAYNSTKAKAGDLYYNNISPAVQQAANFINNTLNNINSGSGSSSLKKNLEGAVDDGKKLWRYIQAEVKDAWNVSVSQVQPYIKKTEIYVNDLLGKYEGAGGKFKRGVDEAELLISQGKAYADLKLYENRDFIRKINPFDGL